MGFATSWLSGLSNAGEPKHSFVIAVRRAKSIDKIAAPPTNLVTYKFSPAESDASWKSKPRELGTDCAIYEDELQRIWPLAPRKSPWQ